MAKGRPRKPKARKDLHGTARKDRESQVQTLPESDGKLGLPRGLDKTVQRHCSRMAKYLRNTGIPIDLIRPLFEIAHNVSAPDVPNNGRINLLTNPTHN